MDEGVLRFFSPSTPGTLRPRSGFQVYTHLISHFSQQFQRMLEGRRDILHHDLGVLWIFAQNLMSLHHRPLGIVDAAAVVEPALFAPPVAIVKDSAYKAPLALLKLFTFECRHRDFRKSATEPGDRKSTRLNSSH